MKNIVLGGRAYAPLATFTLEHDEWVTGLRRKLGLHEIVMFAGETPEQAAERLYSDLLSSGSARRILCGFIVPVVEETPAEWTPALAEETFTLLGKLTVQSEKDTVTQSALDRLEDFWKAAKPRFVTLAQSSRRAESGHQGEEIKTGSGVGAI